MYLTLLVDPTKLWLKDLSLFFSDKKDIESGDWISDAVINAAQRLLHNQFPYYDGFQSSLLVQTHKADIIRGKSIQILHVNRNHWVCVAVNDSKDVISLYDSLYTNIPLTLVDCVIVFIHSSAQVLTFRNLQMQKQTNSSDCGVFAIATATSLCHGEDPTTVVWDTSKMRNHLMKCLLSNKMELFPKRGRAKQVSSNIVRSESKYELHCCCRRRHKRNQVMKHCSICNIWYHKSCINITKEELSINEWKCPNCTT